MTIQVLAMLLIWVSVALLLLVMGLVRRSSLERPLAIGFWLFLASAPALVGAILLLLRQAALAPGA